MKFFSKLLYLSFVVTLTTTSCTNQVVLEKITISDSEEDLLFETKALTETYYKKKLQSFILGNKGKNLIKDLELARFKGESVIPAKAMFKNDISFYNSINNNSFVVQEKSINQPFKVWLEGMLTYNAITIGGTGTAGYNGDNILATNANLYRPFSISKYNNNIYISDTWNNRIRKIDISSGIITTIAGTGTAGYNGDNILSTTAQLNNPLDVKNDNIGNIYITDHWNHRIRKIDVSSGIITTIAGTGTAGYNGDNIQASDSQLNYPTSIEFDKNNNIYIADQSNHRIRKIDVSTGVITTIAGTGTAGYNGDSISATTSHLNYPFDICFDKNNNIYITDQYNHRVRKIDASTGVITTIAGTGSAGYNGDNILASNSQLNYPLGIVIDNNDNLYITDQSNHRVRVFNANGNIQTIAGTGVAGFNSNNISTNTQLNYPVGLDIDNNNNIYITDRLNNIIRKIY